MTRLEMLKWIHETLGEFIDPALKDKAPPNNWQWSNGIFRCLTPDYCAIYRADYESFVKLAWLNDNLEVRK